MGAIPRRKGLPMPEPLTKAELNQFMHDAWLAGMPAAQTVSMLVNRLTNGRPLTHGQMGMIPAMLTEVRKFNAEMNGLMVKASRATPNQKGLW